MSKTCRDICREFKGWCKSFTKTETLLTILEAILLVVFLAFLIFLLLHLFVCKSSSTINGTTSRPPVTTTTDRNKPTESRHEKTHTHPAASRKRTRFSLSSLKTRCTAHFNETTVEKNTNSTRNTIAVTTSTKTEDYSTETDIVTIYEAESTEIVTIVELFGDSDGELAEDDEKSVVVALVKIKPNGLTFGCILTVLSDHWTATAASCLDSIEEVDSLDSFVIMDNYGELRAGKPHTVADVRVHPSYEGANKTYDLALLKTERRLYRRPAVLPSLVDYFKVTIGEKLELFGFGKFRSIDHSQQSKQVHSVPVYTLPLKHCQSSLEPRHLVPLYPVAHGRCGTYPLCVGVLYARGTPCNYCSGSPILYKGLLFGIMSDNDACGSACEPALYVNVATMKNWIQSVVSLK